MATGKTQKKMGVGRHASAIKRNRQSQKRRVRNRHILTTVRTAVKTARLAITEKNKDAVKEKVKKAIVILNKAATKGVIPAGRASRLSSRLTKAAQAIQ